MSFQDTPSFVTHKGVKLKQKAMILLGQEVKYLSLELPEQWEIERGVDKTISKSCEWCEDKNTL